RSVVIAAAMTNGKLQLWLRPLDALQVRPLATTDDATYPFWSPDSRYIGFFAEGKLKKVARTGGPSQSLCDVSGARGGTWSRDDVILFSQYGPGGQGLYRVGAGGGAPQNVLLGGLRYPAFLPDGRHFLYTEVGAGGRPGPSTGGIYVGSL